MGENNESLQADEILALSSIYGHDWTCDDPVQRVYSIQISNNQETVLLQVTLPESYPMESPPIYEISAPWMSRMAKQRLYSALEDIYCQNIGESIIYLWIEKIRNFIDEDLLKDFDSTGESDALTEINVIEAEILNTAEKKSGNGVDQIPTIEHGEPIVDRKSVFQAHVAKVVSVNQVAQVIQKLKENRKIAAATHNIMAYRIAQGNSKNFIQDCDDDGETKAGASLLHLLQILDVYDVLVVVSRWYGGIHLGPDRFRHINNAARNLLTTLGYISEKPQSALKKSKKG